MSEKSSFKRFHIGPGAASLIMILVVLSMSALGVLALANSRGDYSLSVRSAQVAEQIYQLNEQATLRYSELDAVLSSAQKENATEEAYLAAVAGSLPEGMALEDRTVTWTETLDTGRVLHCGVTIDPLDSTQSRAHWSEHRLAYEPEETEEDTWN